MDDSQSPEEKGLYFGAADEAPFGEFKENIEEIEKCFC